MEKKLIAEVYEMRVYVTGVKKRCRKSERHTLKGEEFKLSPDLTKEMIIDKALAMTRDLVKGAMKAWSPKVRLVLNFEKHWRYNDDDTYIMRSMTMYDEAHINMDVEINA